MNILEKYLLSSALRSPDEPAAPEPVVQDPAPVADPAVVAADPVVDPVDPEPAPARAPAPQMVSLKVLQERVGEETNKRQTAEQLRDAALDRVRELEAARVAPDPAVPVRAAAPVAPAADAVTAEAQRILFRRDAESVSEAGSRAYGAAWTDTINLLNALGVNSDDFVSSVMEVDRGRTHELMHALAQDGERAVALAKMPVTRRIAELTRMSIAMAPAADPKPTDPKPAAEPKPAAPAVSRAPAPKPIVAPLAPKPQVDPTTSEGNDELDDKAWEAWYKAKHYTKKSA